MVGREKLAPLQMGLMWGVFGCSHNRNSHSITHSALATGTCLPLLFHGGPEGYTFGPRIILLLAGERRIIADC